MSFGPMQLLVVGFEDAQFKGEIIPELKRLADADVVRLVDLLLVSKDSEGVVSALEASDLTAEESARLGALAADLIGLGEAEEGDEAAELAGLADEVWYVADSIPNGATAAIAILEHRWAIPLRDAIERAGGQALADAWLHPSDLLALGPIPAP